MFYDAVIVARLRVDAITLYPFILFRSKALRENQVLLNHERIHIKQQTELLVLPFYILYVGHYVFNLIKFKNHDAAYRHVIFEREADAEENNPVYLPQRRFYAYLNY